MLSIAKRQSYIRRRRSSHLTGDTKRTEERTNAKDSALKKELARMEKEDSHWDHPIGFSIMSGIRILNLPFEPIYNNTGHWIQPEDLNDIGVMFDSYLNVNCLFYSLLGVLAIEASMSMEVPPKEAPVSAQWMISISRASWCLNGMWCIGAVVCAFHTLWAIHATPNWAKRKFMFENSRAISFVYAMGAPNFLSMCIGVVCGVMGNIFVNENVTKRDWLPSAIGLGISFSVALSFVLCSGSILGKTFRPWKMANDNLVYQTQKSDGQEEEFFDNYHTDGNGDPDGNIDVNNAEAFALIDLGKDISLKLSGAGLTLELMKELDNEVLLDQLIQSAGVDKAGDRIRVLLHVRRHTSLVTTKSVMS